MYIKYLVVLLSLYFLIGNVNGQKGFPVNGFVFDDQEVPRIDIKMHADSLSALLASENINQDHEYPADFFWKNGTAKDTVLNVGIRLRGNTSRSSAKKSFKIVFNHFNSGKFHHLSDLNLNGEHNDPSIIRAKISWDLMKLAGIEAPRSNHVALFINNEYRGLYINVEHIDNDYLEARGKDPDGQLFKCFYGADFVFRGNNPNNYSRTVYEAQNNKDEPDYYTLMEFTRALDDTSNPDFRCNLEKIFDVDEYLKRMAMEILLGHWDNPIYNKNNAYLYFNPVKQKFELLSYDIDNTFGIDWFGVNWAERNIYSWAPAGDPRPVYTNLMKVPEYRIRFGHYIKKFTEDFFNPGFLSPYIDKIKNKIIPYRGNDVYASLDYGYTFYDFLQSYDVALSGHVKTGLKEYIQLRANSAKTQVQNVKITPVITNQELKRTANTSYLSFQVYAINIPEVKVNYTTNGANAQQLILEDNGIFPDQVAGDQKYTFSILHNGATEAAVVITAKDPLTGTSTWPVCGYWDIKLGYNPPPSLIINEFMADNTSIKDEAGEYEDWIELYNSGSSSVWLGDKFLSDNADNPSKWPLPFIDLDPGQFLLIWADEDQEQGDNHANFKLSKSGEFIGLFDSEDNYLAPIDTFSFGPALTNVAYGRYPDGVGPVAGLSKPTPGTSNVFSFINESGIKNIAISPNPVFQTLRIPFVEDDTYFHIADINGRVLVSGHQRDYNTDNIDISYFPAGTFILNMVCRDKTWTTRFIKL